jgi:ketosteroid isomerase-like protein
MFRVDRTRCGGLGSDSDPDVGGRTYHNHVGKFLEVRDGKIAWVREYPDTKHVHDVLLAP